MSTERAKRLTPELRTFQDWSDAGYKILKGSKSVERNPAGVCLFSSDQVVFTRYVPADGMGEDDDLEEYDPDLPGNPDDYGCKD